PGVAAELAAAHERSPRRQEIVFLLAEIGPAAGVPLDRLEPLLRGAAEAEPRLGEAWLRLALLLDVFGRGDDAFAALAEGIAAGARFGGAEQPAVDAILARKGRYGRIRRKTRSSWRGRARITSSGLNAEGGGREPGAAAVRAPAPAVPRGPPAAPTVPLVTITEPGGDTPCRIDPCSSEPWPAGSA